MKKILTASLVAIMAVTAANAEIATTGYVTKKTGDLQFTNESLANKNLTQAIDTLKGELDSVSGGSFTANSIEGSAIKEGTITETQLNASVNASLDKADGAVQEVVTGSTSGTIAVDGTDVQVYGLGSAAYKNEGDFATAAQGALATTALQEADLADYAKTADVVTNDEMTAFETANNQAIEDAKTAVNGYTDTKVGEVNTALTQYKTTNDAAVKANADAIAAMDTNYVSEDQFTTFKGENTQAITDAKTAVNAYTDTKVGEVNTALTQYKTTNDAAVQANADAIAGLNTTYVSEDEMTTFKGENTQAIAEAKTEAVNEAGTAADGKIAALNATVNAETNKLITGIVEEAGLLKSVTSAQITNDYIATNAAIAKTKLEQGVQDSLDAADSAMQLDELKTAESYTTNGCATAGVICSLVSKGGTIAWEKVVDDSATPAE